MDSSLKINTAEFADTYNRPDWWFRFRYDTQHKIKTALFTLKKGNVNLNKIRIFEYGFGSGELLFRFSKSCSINGIEASSSAVNRAYGKAKKLGYSDFSFTLIQDKKDNEFRQKDYDLIIASHILEHLEDPVGFLKEVYYKLGDKGHFLVLIPINERYKDPKHAQVFSSKSVFDLLTSAGFRSILNFENDVLFYLVENLYFRNYSKHWSFADNLKRIMFNLTFATLPLWLIRFIEKTAFSYSNFPPRQSVFLLSKNG